MFEECSYSGFRGTFFCVDSMENDYKNKYCKTLNEMGNWQC